MADTDADFFDPIDCIFDIEGIDFVLSLDGKIPFDCRDENGMTWANEKRTYGD